MNEKQNPYSQQPPQMEHGSMLQMPYRKRIQNRLYNVADRMKSIYPQWVSQFAIVVYIVALIVVSFLYSSHNLPWYYMLSGLLSVMIFFILGIYYVKQTHITKIRNTVKFEKRIFLIAFLPRVLFVLLINWIFQSNYGDSFGFENQDALYYDELAQHVSGLIKEGNFHFYDEILRWGAKDDISDMGYGVYVGFIYVLTGNSMMALRLLKCLLSSLMVVLVYRLAKRNFDDQTARVAALFCALWPNFWYYCSAHLKEVEMVFLSVLFVEQAEQMLRSRQFTAWKVVPILLIAAIMFTFRTPLALVALLALIFSAVMSSSKVVKWGKRVIVGGLAVILIVITMGDRIADEARGMVDTVQGGQQQANMEWRGKRDNGNAFAQYAGKSVFAPLIFTIPFPSMVRPFEGQEQQQLLNGGNYVKNIISFFTIFAMVMLLLTGKWRDHLLPLSFMLGYLVVLTMSTFAQSERFHQPVMPFEFMYAAYGLSIAVTKLKYKRWFTYWCGLMFVACIAWNWFKLAGRGLT